jgi:arsenate reductase
MKILFVCIGNACRSPMAEALFNLEATIRHNDFIAKSAGVRPYTHVIDKSVETMRELGVDISSHKPQSISFELIEWADKIILLDKSIPDDLVNMTQNKSEKIIIWDTEDPYHTSKKNFRKVRDSLHNRILELFIY